MTVVRYSKWNGIDPDEISLEDLFESLADFLLESGFARSDRFPDSRRRSLEALRQALLDALADTDLPSEELLDHDNPDELLDLLIERLNDEGYISVEPGNGTVRFEVTDRGLDFLGYRSLRHLLATLGKGSFGGHDTDRLSTGIEASEASKRYEFGDALNLDVSGTIRSAISREGVGVPINLEYSDLHVHQSEYQSSCATVLMLDCSHSMILYGEDRFTPAKRVALALLHLIRTRYPGDSLKVVLFHDSAEEIPCSGLARARVGPYHTNTREGLRLSRRLLLSQRKDMRQIVMITDGKPSALTLDDGRIYKNPMGLDPRIMRETLREVAGCRRAGIMINTFMLADDYHLVQFVKKVTEVCRGKAYFATTLTLGQYILMDYMKRHTRFIH